MFLEVPEQYKIDIELSDFLNNAITSQCEDALNDNLSFLDHITCHAIGKFIKIIFNPPSEITDEFIFQIIDETLSTAGISFAKAVIKQYVGNLARTATASVTGGVLGSKAGISGLLVGLIAGAVVEKILFDWKPICECTHDQFGNLLIYRNGEEGI